MVIICLIDALWTSASLLIVLKFEDITTSTIGEFKRALDQKYDVIT